MTYRLADGRMIYVPESGGEASSDAYGGELGLCPEFPDNGRFPFLLVLAVEVKVNFLDNLRLEARFDDFTVIADQPIR